MLSTSYVNTLLFGIYPYVCLAVLLLGSLIRFDREPYTWKSDSSQMLRQAAAPLGSNLFHYGVLVVIARPFRRLSGAGLGCRLGAHACRPSAPGDGGRRNRRRSSPLSASPC